MTGCESGYSGTRSNGSADCFYIQTFLIGQSQPRFNFIEGIITKIDFRGIQTRLEKVKDKHTDNHHSPNLKKSAAIRSKLFATPSRSVHCTEYTYLSLASVQL